MPTKKRDHGGAIDAAIRTYGGKVSDWLDLSTGINPQAYPFALPASRYWTALPLSADIQALETAARNFWNVPADAAILAVPGLSSVIANIPTLLAPGTVNISEPTYNEHAASFREKGWSVNGDDHASAQVFVHPNNPDGRKVNTDQLASCKLTIIDESFCDTCPDESHIAMAAQPGNLILKSFGKFWGLAGVRLGFVVGDPTYINQLRINLGPWPVSGPAIAIGRQALTDATWADSMRAQLTISSRRLDDIMQSAGHETLGGTSLFRLYEADDAQALFDRFGQKRILTRIFPYSKTWIRLGLPQSSRDWNRLEGAL